MTEAELTNIHITIFCLGSITVKVLIAGSRGVNDPDAVRAAIAASGFDVTTVLSGGAKGVDRLGEEWAAERGIPVERIKPDWSQGRHAGLLANSELVAQAEAAVIVYDGQSKGTRDTIGKLQKAGKPTHVATLPED